MTPKSLEEFVEEEERRMKQSRPHPYVLASLLWQNYICCRFTEYFMRYSLTSSFSISLTLTYSNIELLWLARVAQTSSTSK